MNSVSVSADHVGQVRWESADHMGSKHRNRLIDFSQNESIVRGSDITSNLRVSKTFTMLLKPMVPKAPAWPLWSLASFSATGKFFLEAWAGEGAGASGRTLPPTCVADGVS